jgi:uncharacterized membrane protein
MPKPPPERTAPTLLVGWIDAVLGSVRRIGAGTLAWTVAVGLGIGTGVFGFFGSHSVLSHPSAAVERRPGLLVGAATLTTIVVALLTARWKKRRGDPRDLSALYGEAIRRGALLSALPALVALREPVEASHSSFVLGLALATGALGAYSAFHWASDRESPRGGLARLLGPLVVAAATVAYAILVTRLAFANHLSFNTGRSDLGYYLSIFRQSSQGIPLGCSLCGGGSHLTGHFDPILVLLSPLFLLHPFAETMLLLQTVWLASGSIPVYLVTLRHAQHRGVAAALAVSYLAYPALHGVNLFDFHSVALCIPLFVWLLYFLEEARAWGYFITLGLLLLVREDIPIALTCVGLSAILGRGRAQARFGWITILVSVVYFVTVKATLMGRVDPLNMATGAKGGYAYFYEALIPSGYSTRALVGTLISDPVFVLTHVFTDDKVDYILKLLVPLLLLPLVAPGRILLAYGAALTLLASRSYLFSIHFQYSSLLIPFLYVLSARGLGRIRSGEVSFTGLSGPRLCRALAFGVLASALVCSWKFGGIVDNSSFQGGFRPLSRDPRPDQLELSRWLKYVARSIPRGAKVAANSRLVTHLGAVTHLYLLEDRRRAEYVVVNVKSRPNGARILAEETRGDLLPVTSLGDVHVYRTHYRDRSLGKDTAETPEP